MKKFRTSVSVIVMAFSGIIGFFAGTALNNEGIGGAILFSLIAGIACLIYAVDNNNE